MKVLSLCTSAGLWDKAFLEAGCTVIPGCEIMAHKRAIYRAFVGGEHLCADINDLPAFAHLLQDVDLIIGGIPCQSRSKTKNLHEPKFGDLLPALLAVLQALPNVPYLLENVAPLDIPGAAHARLNAANYGQPHQSRVRYFTFSPGLIVPAPKYAGTVDDLMAYSVVAGRIYGPKRGAKLQGWPEFADLRFPCAQLQEALADGVPRGLADAWIAANNWRMK